MFEDDIGEGPSDIDPDPGLDWFWLKAEYFVDDYFFFEKRMIIYHS